MRIAQVAPLYEDVPPLSYGGTERVIAGLCDSLAAAGHDVTLFATATSRTSARLEAVVDKPLRVRMSAAEMAEFGPHLHLRMLADVARRASEFDVIHSHVDLLSLPFAAAVDTPTVLTMHGRLDLPLVRQILPLYPGVACVSISDDQRLGVADLPIDWVATVPNGLALDAYHSEPRGTGEYLAFVGRITAEKGPAQAIEIARRTGRLLRLAAKIDPTDEEYFRCEIEPLLRGDGTEFLGELDETAKPAFYAGAAATLFPSDWPEPFGLVLIESLAAGTPVIALRRGAVEEIVEHGVSGFVCDDVDEMVACVGRLDELDPDACRRRAHDFDVAPMRRRYERVYASVLARREAADDEAALSSPLLAAGA